MKTLILSFAFVSLTFASCNKCLTCTSPTDSSYAPREYCKGNDAASKISYDNAKAGLLTDYMGQKLTCR